MIPGTEFQWWLASAGSSTVPLSRASQQDPAPLSPIWLLRTQPSFPQQYPDVFKRSDPCTYRDGPTAVHGGGTSP